MAAEHVCVNDVVGGFLECGEGLGRKWLAGCE